MHGVIKNPELQERIKERMKEENLTFEEYLKRYLKDDSIDPDFELLQKFREIENVLIRRYAKDETQKKKLTLLLEYFWSFGILAAKNKYDIDRLLYDIEADADCGTYKKR